MKRILSIISIISILFSCLIFSAPASTAATAGSYNVTIYTNCSDDVDNGRSENHYLQITYKQNNGTGAEGTTTIDVTKNYFTSTGDKSKSVTIPGFPTKVLIHLDTSFNWGWGSVKAKISKVEVNGTDIGGATDLCESSTNPHEQSASIDASKYPVATTLTAISGNATVNLNTNNTNKTATYTLGTVTDQYGVAWYQDASWDTPTLTNGITFSNGTLTAPASSNRANNYTVTLREKCGSLSQSKTVTIGTFDYKVTFKDYDDTVLKSTQTVDYNASATPPADPERAYDGSFYKFKNWDTSYANITSGNQTITVKAQYYTLTEVETKPEDSINGVVYYTDEDGHFYASTFTDKYEPGDLCASAAAAQQSSVQLPAPAFNQFDCVLYGYNYSTRGASIKLCDPREYTDENTTQPFRFAMSAQVPEGINWRCSDEDNTITDFGVVYSQTKYINTIDDLEYGKPQVYKMSVRSNNSDRGAYNGSNWTGVTYHRDYNQLTFNFVIAIKAKNWTKPYCARAYVTYKSHGRTYTVYDSSFSSRSVEYVARKVVENESGYSKTYCQTKILDHI